MGRIEDKFSDLRRRGDKALIAYLTAGDPDLKATAALMPVMEKSGVDILEIGVPFLRPHGRRNRPFRRPRSGP